MITWEAVEAEVFTRMMLMAEYPSAFCQLYHLYLSIISHGLMTVETFGYLLILITTRFFFQKLGSINNPKIRFWGIFVLYQLIQILILIAEVTGDEENYSLNIIASTVVMMIGEVSPIHSDLINGAIVAKHVAVWMWAEWRHHSQQLLPIMPVAWIFYDVLMSQVLKRRILMAKQKAEEERSNEEKKLKCLLYAIPDGILVISESNEILSYNPALLIQLEVEKSQDPKRALTKVISLLAYDQDYVSVDEKQSAIAYDLSIFMHKPVGSVCNFKPVIYKGKYLECRGCVTQWEEQNAVVLTVRDTSNWVSLEKTAKLDSANKTALLRSVSHELRTPVNAIINLVQDLQLSENLNEQEKSDVEVLLSASNFLLSMINDLLDYSRILHDKFALTKHNFDLEAIVRACGQLIDLQCRQKNVRFSIRYDKLLPKRVFTDENRLKQVILNLLSNAAKFTLRGSITLIANSSGSDRLKISVEDTGIGIPENKIPYIFTMFGKLETNNSLNPQGCGLGLSISSMLVSKLGGSGISVTSTLNQGSTFSFTIPIITSDHRRSSSFFCFEDLDDIPDEISRGFEVHPYGKNQDYKRADVLIVDDSPFNRLVVRKILEASGFSNAEASTGLEAVNTIISASEHGHPFSVVIMDIEMPEMDGITATREVKLLAARGIISSPVVIGCSAFSTEEDKTVALAAGMNYYLEKPISRVRLIEVVSQHCVAQGSQ